MDCCMAFGHWWHLGEFFGDVRSAKQLFARYGSALRSYISAAPPPSFEIADFFAIASPSVVGLETDCLHAFRPELAKHYALFGCTTPTDAARFYDESPEWACFRIRVRSSRDGKHHAHHPDHHRALHRSLVTLASARTNMAVETGWLDELPAAGSATMYEIGLAYIAPVGSRTLVRHCLLHIAR